jgi:hypothetical protein
METVNQSVIGIIVSVLLGGCVAAQPASGDTTGQPDVIAARILTPDEWSPGNDVDLLADAPWFTEPDGAWS